MRSYDYEQEAHLHGYCISAWSVSQVYRQMKSSTHSIGGRCYYPIDVASHQMEIPKGRMEESAIALVDVSLLKEKGVETVFLRSRINRDSNADHPKGYGYCIESLRKSSLEKYHEYLKG
jgi:hypothetical protein